ncbi:hypothetical protein ACE10W_37180 [Bradyrhizobium sp. B025]|uniref:hypothetical protein n=1 Tax=Bradyrhizobium sp. B025 TaxID=3344829 RepID=UPI0035D4E9FB
MQPTYFASFLLGSSAAAERLIIGDALEEVSQWIFSNPYRQLARPAGWPNNVSEPIKYPNGERVQLLTLQDEATLQTAAVRFEHPDQQGRFWRTDCILTNVNVPEPGVRFAVTVAAGSLGDGLFPVSPPSSRPRIVRALIDKFGGREHYPLQTTFVQIGSEEAERFASFLLDPERTLPLVFISRRNRDEAMLCDPSELADKLVGIAYVGAANSAQLSWKLADHIDNRLNAYDATVRVYWPRMTQADPPYRHRWWTQQQLFAMQATGRSFANELLRLIATASVTRRISGLVRWEDIERELTKRTIQQLQHAGTLSSTVSEEWLRQYELDLSALGAARQELAEATDRLLEREEEVRQWKQMYLQLLRTAPAESGEPLSDSEALIEDADSAIETASRDFKEQLVILNGRVEKDASQFEEPELLYAALKWLATTYRKAKIGATRCADLDKSCRETCQFRYNAHQSEITMGMFASDYEVRYGNSKTPIKLKEHIGFGTSTEPRHTIRIAFFFDEDKKKVIVGYIGQHQATRKSN